MTPCVVHALNMTRIRITSRSAGTVTYITTCKRGRDLERLVDETKVLYGEGYAVEVIT